MHEEPLDGELNASHRMCRMHSSTIVSANHIGKPYELGISYVTPSILLARSTLVISLVSLVEW